MTDGRPLLTVEGLVKTFPVTRGTVLRRTHGIVRAVDDVSLDIAAGQTLGLVGESGCGKSTLACAVLRLVEPTAGRVVFDGTDVTACDRRALRGLRRQMQIVFQDPYASLDPRMTVAQSVAEPLHLHGIVDGRAAARRRVAELLALVGLEDDHARRYPHALSGGQRQRVAIARAIATRPRLLILDEPVSSLDVSIRGQILNLLADLQSELGLAYLLIAHDLALVRHACHRVAVMYLGRIVEEADGPRLFAAPQHPYTQALMSAAPLPDPQRERTRTRLPLDGEPPGAATIPAGCRFHPRCFAARDVCREREPSLAPVDGDHLAACLFPETRRVL